MPLKWGSWYVGDSQYSRNMPYEPIVPNGQHLGTSHEVDGAVTGHLFEDGKLKGHAAWQWVDEPVEGYSSNYQDEQPRQLTQEELELAAKIAALIVLFLVGVVTEATPHVKRWWNGTAIPTVKTFLKRVTAPRKAKNYVATGRSSSAGRATFVASATGVKVAVTESKISMSSAEWEHRFRAMLAADEFKNEQLQILSQARIEDEDTSLKPQNDAEQLTAEQFADRIKLMLEANPSLLNRGTSAELMRIFSSRSKRSNEPGRPGLEQ